MHLVPTKNWCTEQVELFLLEPAHVGPIYVGWLADTEVNRYLESRFLAHTELTTCAFVRNCLDDPGTLFLGIRSKALNFRHVGNIKLSPIDQRHGLAEVGILIGERSAWGRGIASDAITATCEIARDQLSLRKLTAGCYASNLGSVKAFQRAGFQVEGTRRDHFILQGKLEDLVLMAKWL
jgi:[ribosomal protein S5]-alanine N-acetyltransferase